MTRETAGRDHRSSLDRKLDAVIQTLADAATWVLFKASGVRT